MATLLTGTPNVHGVGKNRDSRQISGFGVDRCWTVACRQPLEGGVGLYAIARIRRPSPAINNRRRATHQ